jgi:hypothetical protein
MTLGTINLAMLTLGIAPLSIHIRMARITGYGIPLAICNLQGLVRRMTRLACIDILTSHMRLMAVQTRRYLTMFHMTTVTTLFSVCTWKLFYLSGRRCVAITT